MNKRIDFETLTDYFSGQLAPEKARQVAAWIAENPEEADVTWLRAFHDVSEQVVFPALTESTHRDLLALFEQKKPVQEKRPLSFQRLIAALTFDSHSAMLPAMRTAQMAARQLMFSSELVDVALDVMLISDTFTLSGQLLFNADARSSICTVTLLQDGHVLGEVQTDDLGEFVFSGIKPGTCQLILNHDQFELVIDPLVLQIDER